MIWCVLYSVIEKNQTKSLHNITKLLYSITFVFIMYIFDLVIYGIHIAPTWYGLAYAFGFIICYFFMRYHFNFRESSHIDSFLTFVFFGIILGGRTGYIVFYDLPYFIEHPLQILKIWE